MMERVAPFTLRRPATLSDAVAFLAATPGSRLIAGGTDLIPNLRDGLGSPSALVDLAALPELNTIVIASEATTIGAAVTLAHLATDARLRHALPILAEAATSVAGPSHRTVATVGGNLCLDTRCIFYNQSEWWRRANAYCLKLGGDSCHVAPQGRRCHAAFSGDLAPALLVLDAQVEIASAQGRRRMPLAKVYVDDGAAHLALDPGEILVAVHIPPQPPAARAGYRKARVRGALDFPLAGVAARIDMRSACITELRVALTGTNSRPFLLEGTGELAGRTPDDDLFAQLAKLVRKQVSPMRTTVTHSNYRRQVAAVLAQRLVRQLVDSVASRP